MEWLQVSMMTVTIIGTLGGFMFWQFSKIDSDIKSLDTDIKQAHRRMDQLYQVIIDILKH